MVEGVLLNIVAGFVANVTSEPFKSIKLSFGVKDELRKLNNTLTTIQAVLLDAEQKKDTNSQVKVWLHRLEDVVYDADNLLDEFRYQQLRRRVLFGKKKAKKVHVFFSKSNQLVFRLKMAKKIKHIRETLDDIKSDQVFLTLVKRDHEETRSVTSTTMGGRETHSLVISEEVIGRENDKREIIDILLDSNLDKRERIYILLDGNIENAKNVSIVSLVGIGGLGKTTLAQLVFNDKEVEKHFDKKMWVCVSDVFDLKLLVQKIIRSVTGKSLDQNLDLEQLQNQLREEIGGKRYLLVLDDVWNEESEKWDRLKTFLKLGAQGSRVLITTRSIRVAQIVRSVETVHLSALDVDRSWDLFKKVAFEEISEQSAQYHHLVKIGKDIAGKCKGVPLAIKTIGRLLQSKKYTSQNLERDWINFRDTELAQVDNQTETDILPTLRLSYNNLPSHLKQCFAYSSLFPKDHRIHVGQLIRLWMAQGFIKPDSNRNRQLEEIGYEYFRILYLGCFFQEAENFKFSDTIEYCKMHDLMHDLASLVAGKSVEILNENILGELECNANSARLDRDTGNALAKVRHIYVDSKSDKQFQIPRLLMEQKKMRTFILANPERLSLSDYDDILSNLKLLRALSLLESDMETLPNRLGKLKHLRYLDLSGNVSIKELPNSITELYNLETLILRDSRNLVSLPSDIQNLINLRHLEITGSYSLTHMPRGIGEMTSLQTLDMFVVADDNQSSQSKSAGLGELIKLKNLHGHLTIKFKSCKVTPMESGVAQYLKDMEHLQCLSFYWETRENAEQVLERLEPPQNIKSIEVLGCYLGETFPSWLSSLNHLVRLTLSNCRQCKYLPPLHHLSSLQELTLEHLRDLEYVSEWDDIKGDKLSTSSKSLTSMPFFPSLTILVIYECSKLKEWFRALTEHQQPFFPFLTKLEISDCPLLTSMPLFPNLENLKLKKTSSKPLQQTFMMKLKGDNDGVAAAASSSTSSSSPTSALSKLKDLSIQLVDDLTSLPEGIGSLSSLTDLTIRGCSNLTSLPEGIGSLSSLTYLRIGGCSNLTSLPEGIGSLSSLTYLRIVGCSNLTSLPEGIGSLSSLTDLRIGGCSNLTSLPEGIGSLSSLTYLRIVGCSNLTSLPEGIGSLSSLTDLTIQGCSNLTSLPEGIDSLSLLTDLSIVGCSNLTSLPEGIGSLSSLTDLTIEGCSNLTSLPEGIGSLSSLTSLIIEGCSNLTSLPEGIGSLSSLTDLRIGGCSNLTSLPEGIGSLSSLTDLTIEGCSNLTSLPEGIGSLSSLTDLRIGGCSNFTSLPEGIGSLSSLTYLRIVGCSDLTSLPEGIGSLSSLTDLTIEGCSNLTSLPEGIGSLSSLTDLTIEGCSNLTSLPEGIGSLSSLTSLIIEGCSNLTSLPEGIGSLSSLTYLRIVGCSNLTSLPEGIGSLSSLTSLTIEGCSNLTSLPEGIGSLSSLTDLTIEGCSNLTSLPEGIGSLSSLTSLIIEGCNNLTSLPEGIGSLSSLTYLRIVGCSNLTSLPEGIGSLSSLTSLTIEGCSNLTSLPERIGSLSSL